MSDKKMFVEEKKKGVYKNLLTGGCSAALARTITNPIERVEILRQIGNPEFKGVNLIQSLIKFYRAQGLNGLFKGNSASVARIFPFSAIEFYTLETCKNIIIRGKPQDKYHVYRLFICGTIAGLNAATITYPLDIARTLLAIKTTQSEIKAGLVQTLIHIFKSEGLKGYYKGYSLVFIGTVPFIAIKQTGFEFLKENFMIEKYRNTLNYVYGSGSGLLATIVLYPTYMLKRVLQSSETKKNLTTYFKEIQAKDGLKGFYKGLSMTLLKTAPYQGFLFWSNEKFKKLLKY